MVGTICPAGGRTHQRQLLRRVYDSATFLIGSCIGGVALGSLLGVASEVVVTPYVGVTGVAGAGLLVLALTVFIEESVLKVSLPSISRQVSASWWTTYGARLAAVGWGLQLGTGCLTRVSWGGYYAAVVLALLVAMPYSILTMGAYGLIRGLQPIHALWRLKLSGDKDFFFSIQRFPNPTNIGTTHKPGGSDPSAYWHTYVRGASGVLNEHQ